MNFTDANLRIARAAPREWYEPWRDELGAQDFRTVSLSLAGGVAAPIYTAVMVKFANPFRGRSFARISKEGLRPKIDLLREQRLHPYILTATGPAANPVYAACFREMDEWPFIRENLSADEYKAETAFQQDMGKILLWVDAFGSGDDVRYCAIWGANPERIAWNAEAVEDKQPDRQQRYDALRSVDARPALFAMTHRGGLARMFVDTRLTRSFHSSPNVGPDDIDAEIAAQEELGRRPVRIGTAVVDNKLRYSLIFAKSDNIVPRSFRVWGELPAGSPVRPIDAWVESYMKAHGLRGAALAIVEGTRLVYAQGYTWAEADYPDMLPTTLFRMGSVAKTFCAVAVWTLLAATDRYSRRSLMQDILNLRGPGNTDPADDKLASIRVSHLLESCSGIDQMSVRNAIKDRKLDKSLNQPITQAEIAEIIAGKPMLTGPGGDSIYGRTDYFLLSLIAAKLAGEADFETALKKVVLDPLAMTRTRGSRSRLETQPSGHAPHHAARLATGVSAIHDDRRLVPRQYGKDNLEVFDGAGGVSSAAVDLARLCAMFACRAGNNPLMSDRALIEMLAAAAAADAGGGKSSYGFDIATDRGSDHYSLEKGGTLPGVRTGFTGRTNRQICILLRNGEPWPQEDLTDWKTAIKDMAKNINWRGIDLFPNYGMPSL